ncbi:metal-sulfur cluster assembly factor [Rubrolithibacter danxiaensis]|uniref:metal-sulfur cluster assembly factor n=1 Tax=Rubrolithibacter danxiaensis TaxID=3390805 RepID=UPI003BF89A0C
METFDITKQSSFLEVQIWEVLRSVIDPELHVNIVDLGLVYQVEADENTHRITIAMTLSSRYCPMGEAILQSVKNSLELNFPAFESEVNLVWEPEWSYDNISEEGRRLLGN